MGNMYIEGGYTPTPPTHPPGTPFNPSVCPVLIVEPMNV
jgi:hypothetical protein